jgi:hypothetical protein
MGYFDDIARSVTQAAGEAFNSANEYFKNQQSVSAPAVKSGPEPTGNLTALQIEQGVRAGVPGVAVAEAPQAVAAPKSYDFKKIAMYAAAAAAALVIFKKRKG